MRAAFVFFISLFMAMPAVGQKPENVGEAGEWQLLIRIDTFTGKKFCYLSNETDMAGMIHVSSVQRDIMANNGQVLSKRSEYRIDDGEFTRVRETYEHHSVIIDDASQLLGAKTIEIIFDVWHGDPDPQIFNLGGIEDAWEWLTGPECAAN